MGGGSAGRLRLPHNAIEAIRNTAANAPTMYATSIKVFSAARPHLRLPGFQFVVHGLQELGTGCPAGPANLKASTQIVGYAVTAVRMSAFALSRHPATVSCAALIVRAMGLMELLMVELQPARPLGETTYRFSARLAANCTVVRHRVLLLGKREHLGPQSRAACSQIDS